jgi:hypothetical protein
MRIPSCTYLTLCNVICLIIQVLSLHGSIIFYTQDPESLSLRLKIGIAVLVALPPIFATILTKKYSPLQLFSIAQSSSTYNLKNITQMLG